MRAGTKGACVCFENQRSMNRLASRRMSSSPKSTKPLHMYICTEVEHLIQHIMYIDGHVKYPSRFPEQQKCLLLVPTTLCAFVCVCMCVFPSWPRAKVSCSILRSLEELCQHKSDSPASFNNGKIAYCE